MINDLNLGSIFGRTYIYNISLTRQRAIYTRDMSIANHEFKSVVSGFRFTLQYDEDIDALNVDNYKYLCSLLFAHYK